MLFHVVSVRSVSVLSASLSPIATSMPSFDHICAKLLRREGYIVYAVYFVYVCFFLKDFVLFQSVLISSFLHPQISLPPAQIKHPGEMPLGRAGFARSCTRRGEVVFSWSS